MKELMEELEEQIIIERNRLLSLEAGTAEYDSTIKALDVLYEKYAKLEMASHEDDKLEISRAEVKEKKKSRIGGWIISGLTFVGTVGAYVWANQYNWQQEREDTMTSTGGKDAQRNLFGLLKRHN